MMRRSSACAGLSSSKARDYEKAMKQLRIFFDTEFTGLAQAEPMLISFGAVDTLGREFYREVVMNPEIIEKSDPWVRTHVWCHLEGGGVAKPFTEVARDLYDWLISLSPAKDKRLVFITDAPIADARWVRALLEQTGYPENMDRHVRHLSMPSSIGWQRFHNVVAQYQRNSRTHHALDDAKATRAAWRAAHRNLTLTCANPGGGTFTS